MTGIMRDIVHLGGASLEHTPFLSQMILLRTILLPDSGLRRSCPPAASGAFARPCARSRHRA